MILATEKKQSKKLENKQTEGVVNDQLTPKEAEISKENKSGAKKKATPKTTPKSKEEKAKKERRIGEDV